MSGILYLLSNIYYLISKLDKEYYMSIYQGVLIV